MVDCGVGRPGRSVAVSVKWITQAFEQNHVKGLGRLVLLAIADAADDDGVCWPSVPTLARKAGLSPRTCHRVLDALRQKGVVSWTARQGTSSLYQLHAVPSEAPITESDPCQPDMGTPANLTGVKNMHPCQPDRVPLPLAGRPPLPTIGRVTVKNRQRTVSRARSRRERFPSGFTLTDQRREYARTKGLDAGGEFEQFADHHRAKGTTFLDWDAAWRTWCRNAVKFNRKATPPPKPRVDLVAAAEAHRRARGL